MEAALAVDDALVHAFLGVLYLPAMYLTTASLSGLIGCDNTFWLLVAYFVFAVGNAVAVDVWHGLMQMLGSYLGLGGIIRECIHGPPVLAWVLSDLALLAGQRDAALVKGAALNL